MIKAWCYVCSSWAWCTEYNPYNRFEDGTPMPNFSKYCIKCMTDFHKSRLKLEKLKELRIQSGFRNGDYQNESNRTTKSTHNHR